MAETARGIADAKLEQDPDASHDVDRSDILRPALRIPAGPALVCSSAMPIFRASPD